MQGLINGVNSKSGSLSGAVTTAVSGAVSAAKTAAGTHSPSTITHGIGQNLMEGLANGILDNADLATVAMTKVATAVAGVPIHAPVVTGPSPAIAALSALGAQATSPAVAASASGGDTVITVAEGAVQIHLHGAVSPAVAAAAQAGAENGIAQLTAALRGGSNPARRLPAS
jgi:hypothetical protein